MKTFYLGCANAAWLKRTAVPLFISHSTLRRVRNLPESLGPVAIDSMAFMVLLEAGAWEEPPQVFADAAEQYCEKLGNVDFVSIRDWMCEEIVCASVALTEGLITPNAKKLRTLMTKLRNSGKPITPKKRRAAEVKACLPLDPVFWARRVKVHQRRTVASYLELTRLKPMVNWLPVLQGHTEADYVRCAALYESHGVRLQNLPLVGLGSVCRRQNTDEIVAIVRRLNGMNLKLHGFGVKLLGLRRIAPLLETSDSMAWSYQARALKRPVCGSTTHKNCANCLPYAHSYYEKVMEAINERGSFTLPVPDARELGRPRGSWTAGIWNYQ